MIGDGGFVFALEKRGYVKAGPWTPEATVEHPEAGQFYWKMVFLCECKQCNGWLNNKYIGTYSRFLNKNVHRYCRITLRTAPNLLILPVLLALTLAKRSWLGRNMRSANIY